MKNSKPLIGISMGDPNGIGMEIIIKTFQDPFIFDYCTPVLYALPSVYSNVRNALQIDAPPYHLIQHVDQAEDGKLNLIATSKEKIELTLGKADKDAGLQALKAIDLMLKDVADGKLNAIVTAPVDKNSINQNIAFNGHTGYIAQYLGVKDYLMILFNDAIKVGLVTEHLPLKDVVKAITKELIQEKGNVLIASLQNDFGITKPKIAVLGLNPHAGDNGSIGSEEKDVIAPAIKYLAENNHAVVFGPYPGDSFWSASNIASFDAVLAMYHDQGLAPFKALAFDEGVNFTAGLPIVRTSPDHGTAYDIAASFSANYASFSTALFEAIHILAKRKEWANLKDNFLPFIEHKRERFRLETRDLQDM
jgi:4-hydroxythreonine-4-phosphate dehydrogenase